MNKELTAEEARVFISNKLGVGVYTHSPLSIHTHEISLWMEEYSNLKNQELQKEIEELKKFIQENHILLRKYKDCGSETFGGRMYFKSKTMLTNKQH